jgi:crossover junction endodeoxyribonuclease RuvC
MPDGLVLGIDPGLAATGYGLLDQDNRVTAFGCIRTGTGAIGARLLQIVGELRFLLAAHAIKEAALEELFMGKNRTSVIGVAQARGAILATLEAAGVAAYEYKPSQVKSLITGYGAADKAQIARMLAVQLKTSTRIDDHAADALAIALCHLRSRRMLAAVRT